MKEFYDTKFYTIPEVATMLMAAGKETAIKNELLREVMLCSAIAFHESIAQNKPLLIGKVMVQDSPWDVIIYDEVELRAIHGTSKPMVDPFLVQLKEVFVYDLKNTLDLVVWIKEVQQTIDKANDKYRGREPAGILHLYNRIPVTKTNLRETEETLQSITSMEPVPFKQIVITVEAGELGMITWQVYPFFHAVGKIGEDEIIKLKELYGFQ
jgi:hypothetical protein